jgi:hypothetical protein
MRLIGIVLVLFATASCAAGGAGGGGAAGGGDSGRAGESVFDPDSKTLIHNRLGVSMAFPNLEEWRIRTKNYRFGVYGTLIEAEKPTAMGAMFLQADEYSQERTTMAYYLKRRMEIESDNLEDVSTVNKVINGFPATCWTYTDLLFGERYTYKRYFLLNQPGTEYPINYDLMFWLPSELYAQEEDQIEAIASTISFFK